MQIKSSALLLATTLALYAAPSFARPPSDVADLVGIKGASGEDALTSRGYGFIKSTNGNGGNYAFWWNGRSGQCIRVLTADGRYQQIATATAGDCDQRSNNTHSNQDAAALYEQGRQSALAGHRPHNNAPEYMSGYNAGAMERDDQARASGGGSGSSNRDDNDNAYGRLTVSELNALRSTEASKVLGTLSRHGFTEARRIALTDVNYWNNDAGQCINFKWKGLQTLSIYEVPRQSCF